MSLSSTSVGAKLPLAVMRSAQAVQQPQFGSLCTVIGTGFATAAPQAAESPPVTMMTVAAPTLLTKARRAIGSRSTCFSIRPIRAVDLAGVALRPGCDQALQQHRHHPARLVQRG